MMSAQASFVAACIMGDPSNFGAALLPIFSYKKGQLWMVEAAAVKSLAMTGLNVDHCWSMCFTKKTWAYQIGAVSGLLKKTKDCKACLAMASL